MFLTCDRNWNFWCNLVMIIVSLNGCYVSNFLSFLAWLLYSINSLFCLSTCAQHYIFQCCLAVLEFVLQNINYLKLVENWSLCSQKGCVGIRHINYKRFRQTENKIPIDRVPSIRCWCWIEEVYCSLLKQKKNLLDSMPGLRSKKKWTIRDPSEVAWHFN